MRCWSVASLLLLLLSGALTQDGFDLSDAFDDDNAAPTPAKPKEQPKAPEKPKSGGELDLLDAFGPGDVPTKKPQKPSDPKPKPVNPPKSGGGDFDLEDALGPDPKPDKPDVNQPKSGGGGGAFDDSDLMDVSGGDYKPDGGRSGGVGGCRPGQYLNSVTASLLQKDVVCMADVPFSINGASTGRVLDPGNDHQGGADPPQEAGSGQIAGIASAIGVALLGAASSYFAYQKKKLCFKIQGGADPESAKGHPGSQSEPQVFSDLLRAS